jgi:hypothetical protein
LPVPARRNGPALAADKGVIQQRPEARDGPVLVAIASKQWFAATSAWRHVVQSLSTPDQTNGDAARADGLLAERQSTTTARLHISRIAAKFQPLNFVSPLAVCLGPRSHLPPDAT